ncbi:hypothetical protein HK103_005080 [Boothiomyces macroporosus]|uniref:DNA-directed RNA polymerase III subunit RPC9 n=1 Tax=Boothiomyces macroporosus TaxID=261099 RepID=A0AAD5UIH5_9FUNG|nr:hypothetical protein HK103_005080 [Boothiomyces macroporosus]
MTNLELYAWGQGFNQSSFDPFCLSIEAYLNLVQVKWVVNECYSTDISPSGELPLLKVGFEPITGTFNIIKVLKSRVSNYEVLQFFSTPFETVDPAFQDYRTAMHTTTKFLSDPMLPCSQQTVEQIVEYKKRFRDLKLTKLEKLSILNNRPQSLVELVVLVEEIDERFSEQEQQQILELLDCLEYERPQEEEE